MTVQTTENTVSYTGNGNATQFNFTFKTLDEAHIETHLDGILQSGGYVVTLNPDQDAIAGGNVTFTLPPASNIAVTVQREVPLTQLVDYQPYDPFPAETHEKALDKLTMEIQQVNEEVERALQAPIGADPSVSLILPPPSSGKALAWKIDESGLENVPAASSLLGSSVSTEEHIATDGQTIFIMNALHYDYASNNTAVYINGVKQLRSAYTIFIDEVTIELSSGAEAGDTVEILISDYVTTAAGGDGGGGDQLTRTEINAMQVDAGSLQGIVAAGFQLSNSDIPTQKATKPEMQAGTEVEIRSMSPVDVKDAIDALSSGGGGGNSNTAYLNVAIMAADGALAVGDTVSTMGYYDEKDGGGNEYVIVAAGTGTDDGGSYIDLVTYQAKATFPAKRFNAVQFGAKGDGTDTSAAFQACFDYVPEGASIYIPAGSYNIVTYITGTKFVVWEGNGALRADGISPLDTELTGTSGIVHSTVLTSANRKRTQTYMEGMIDDQASMSYHRNADYTGGDQWSVNNIFRLNTVVGADTNTSEWSFLSQVHNYCENYGQQVSVYAQAMNYNTSGDSAVWAGVFEARDESSSTTAIAALYGLEIDVVGNGLDPYTKRRGIDIIAFKRPAGTQAMECGYGIIMQPGASDLINETARFGVGLKMIGDYNFCIDLTQATNKTNGSGIYLAADMDIAFDYYRHSTVHHDSTIRRLYFKNDQDGFLFDNTVQMNKSFSIPSSGNTSPTATAGTTTLPTNPFFFLKFVMDGVTYKIPAYKS